ncbi:MAG: hypothetical protein KUA43_17210 [Hoeflea sp.]|uniref:hypothetical protein n=1 Tax=Hoeflea sp. TaxID=1940281 RepID=UPI001D32A911|nr:hypothetical protein [Hoeflea sp.]MBU4529014.1 hypothetical protein [Alphaproteobacteria bacterium]MBU4543419.1 hypothetical protein [Alphaproteobacteria bacterium]MBU4549044.1 hypothetical protein [Alphaproteobacteria bacterium]MBV1725179.1 hypothetical protein [Hoeflea sp.]MBV1785140.1 hypothetical protein [Hoeflea sp.]
MARGKPVVFERIRLLIRRVFVELGIFSAATNILMLVMPLYMLQIYDRVLSSRSLETLLYLSIIAGGALVVLGLLEIVRGIYASRVAARFDIELSPMAIRLAMISPAGSLQCWAHGDSIVIRRGKHFFVAYSLKLRAFIAIRCWSEAES